jgi:hypothetical protein
MLKNAIELNSAARLDLAGPWLDTESIPSPQAIHLQAPVPRGGVLRFKERQNFAHRGPQWFRFSNHLLRCKWPSLRESALARITAAFGLKHSVGSPAAMPLSAATNGSAKQVTSLISAPIRIAFKVCDTTISRIGIQKIAGDDQLLRACRQRGDNCPLGRMLASTGWNGPGCGSECISHDCSVTMFL